MLKTGLAVVIIIFSIFILTYTISDLPETITGSSPAMGNCNIKCFKDSDCNTDQRCMEPGSCYSECINITKG